MCCLSARDSRLIASCTSISIKCIATRFWTFSRRTSKEFAVHIGRFPAQRGECGVNGRAVDGGLACDGSRSALNSPGVWALIGYPIDFPSPFNRPQELKRAPRKGKKEGKKPIRAVSGYSTIPDNCKPVAGEMSVVSVTSNVRNEFRGKDHQPRE